MKKTKLLKVLNYRTGGLFVGFVGSVISAVALAGSGPADLSEGAYTEEQAEQGQPLYEQYCSSCHNEDFYRGTLTSWEGDPVLWLYEDVAANMPGDRPGALLPEEYQAIMAYIFSTLGYPAGEQELNYTTMDDLLVVAPE